MAKKKKGGAGADKAAQEERLLELQKKLDDAETTLEEARKESEKMSRDKAGLLHQLATLEQVHHPADPSGTHPSGTHRRCSLTPSSAWLAAYRRLW